MMLSRLTRSSMNILDALVHGPRPAYSRDIRDQTGLPLSTISTALARMQKRGWLVSEQRPSPTPHGPSRKYYDFAEGGLDAAQELLAKHGRN